MSIVSARCLLPHELARLGHNTATAAKAERDSCSAASFSAAGDEPVELEPFVSEVDQAIRSPQVAA